MNDLPNTSDIRAIMAAAHAKARQTIRAEELDEFIQFLKDASYQECDAIQDVLSKRLAWMTTGIGADFESTIQDIPVLVKGDYDPPDRNVGWPGSYIVTRIWLESDPAYTDIQELITADVLDRLEIEGYERMEREGGEK